MGKLIADLYVICWKYFEYQAPNDTDFMASATCGASVCFVFLNIAQIVAFSLGRNLGFFYFPSKGGQLLEGLVIVLIGVSVTKFFIHFHPDLKSDEGIVRRYSTMSEACKNLISGSVFANLVLLLVVHFIAAE